MPNPSAISNKFVVQALVGILAVIFLAPLESRSRNLLSFLDSRLTSGRECSCSGFASRGATRLRSSVAPRLRIDFFGKADGDSFFLVFSGPWAWPNGIYFDTGRMRVKAPAAGFVEIVQATLEANAIRLKVSAIEPTQATN